VSLPRRRGSSPICEIPQPCPREAFQASHLRPPLPPPRTFGKLSLIWGALLPLITLPQTLAAAYPTVPLLNLILSAEGFGLGWLVLSYADVISGSLTLIAVGISSLALPADPE
jgi:hypothetical protein